ncbi:MAG: SHOCT domain-containing protein [[Eubacterium] siraeum]
MTEKEFTSELGYMVALSIAKRLRGNGLLTDEEYAVIDTNLQSIFHPILGTLFSELELTI